MIATPSRLREPHRFSLLTIGAAVSQLTAMLPELRWAANQEMWSAWHGAGLHHGTPSEVACILNLVRVALPKVDAVWRQALNRIGVNVQLQGVVCHGHPWVKFPGATARCELGDYLLVHDHQPVRGPLERRAAIVQAKVFHRTGVRAKNAVQLELYRRWPRFAYESWPGGLSALASVHARAGLTAPSSLLLERELTLTGRRPASPAMLDDGCRYGMIDVEYSRWGDPKIGMNPWRLCSAQGHDVYTSRAGYTLGSYLVRLMAGEVGREVTNTDWPASLHGACHWSLMVMELLSILPSAPASGSGHIAYLAATPNLDPTQQAQFQSPSGAKAEMGDGGFAVIQVRTSGDLGDRLRRAD